MNHRFINAGLLVVTLASVACSGAGAPVEPESDPSAVPTTGTTHQGSRPAATDASPKDGTVGIYGTVESVESDASNGAPAWLSNADVCLQTASAKICTQTDKNGRYELRVPSSDEDATLTVAHEGYMTTSTAASARGDSDHQIGLLPTGSVSAEQATHGIVLVRGFLSVYFAVNPASGIGLSTFAADGEVTATAQHESFTVYAGLSEGHLDIDPHEAVLTCGTWTGSEVEFTPATADVQFGVVKQVDVVCGPDANEM